MKGFVLAITLCFGLLTCGVQINEGHEKYTYDMVNTYIHGIGG